MNWKPGAGANSNPTVRMIRRAQTLATAKYGTGGRPKQPRNRRPITLPKLKIQQDERD